MDVIDAIGSKNKYCVYVNNDLDKFVDVMNSYITHESKVFVITDNKVASLYEDTLNLFSDTFNAYIYQFVSGEENKNYETISDIYKFLLDNDGDRNSILIAFGGGVVGDMSGFIAATFMRGIKFINIPTTLVAQVDSSVGGKTGYNYNGIKNAIGCFYDPLFVYISTKFLKTLTEDQVRDGMGEVVKYGIIRSKDLLEFIDCNYKDISSIKPDYLTFIIKECINIKAKVICEDYTDLGLRNILNFGHTVGHGIEISSNYSIHHGMAVALGMLVAIKLSEKLLNLSEDVINYIENIYKKIGLPIRYKVDNYSSFLYAIRHDKKNAGDINFVLIEDIGNCRIKIPVEEQDILWAINESIAKED